MATTEQPPLAPPRVVHASPPPRPRRRWSLWRARLLLLVVVLGCVALGTRQIGERVERRDRVGLANVVLTAEPVEVLSPSPGRVVQMGAAPQDEVATGDLLMLIAARDPATGRPRGVRVVAPVDGTASRLLVRAGSSVRGGDVVARLYRPDELFFRAEVRSDDLPDVEIGMTARLRVDGVGTVDARVVRLEPRLEGDVGTEGTNTVILRPEQPAEVRDLLPGLRFQGWLDRDSAPPAAPASGGE